MVTIQFDIPKKMRDVAQTPGIQDKPYDLCFECPFRGATCDGPNEQAMEMPRRIEWWNRLAKQQRMTRQEAADIAGLPLATVNSIMTGRTTDPRHSTMQALSRAYSGGCWGKYPCHFAALLLNGELTETTASLSDRQKIKELSEEVAQLKAREQSIIEHAEEQSQKKVDYLKSLIEKQDTRIEQQETELKSYRAKIMVALSIAAALGFIIAVALLVDMTNPNIGFFWLDG